MKKVTYGKLKVDKLINDDAILYQYNGKQVSLSSTAKKWNVEVEYYNRHLVILAKQFR